MTQAKLQDEIEIRMMMIKREIMIWIREMKIQIIELKIPTFVIVMQLLMIVILHVFQMLRMFQTQFFRVTKDIQKKKAPPVRKETPKKA